MFNVAKNTTRRFFFVALTLVFSGIAAGSVQAANYPHHSGYKSPRVSYGYRGYASPSYGYKSGSFYGQKSSSAYNKYSRSSSAFTSRSSNYGSNHYGSYRGFHGYGH